MKSIDEIIAKYAEPVCSVCGGKMGIGCSDETWFCINADATPGDESAAHWGKSLVMGSSVSPDLAVVAMARELQQMRIAFTRLCGARFRIGDQFIDLEWNDIGGKKVWKAFMGKAGEFPAPWRSEPFDTAWEAYQAAAKIAEGDNGPDNKAQG